MDKSAPPSKGSKGRLASIILPILFIALASGVFISLVYLKFDTFRNWRYEYDLFSFNTAITETAKGHIGLDFEYGNTFGDHAYLFVLLLAPLKYILGSRMIYLLLSLAAIAHYLSSLVFFYFVTRRTSCFFGFTLSVVYLIGFTYILQGLLEDVWGMHPDTLAGFLLVAVTCFYLMLDDSNLARKWRRLVQVMLAITLILFLSLKEEMVILAIIYFAIVAISKRSKRFAIIAAAMVVLLVFDFQFIEWFRTPYNRTNAKLILGFLGFLNDAGFVGLFLDQKPGLQILDWFWIFITSSSAFFAAFSAMVKRSNAFIIALFLTGIAKLLISLVTFDPDLYTWHNIPGVTMVVAAVLLQLAEVYRTKPKLACVFGLGFILASMLCFAVVDVPQYQWLLYKNFDKRRRVQVVTNDLDEVKKLIDPDRVVGVPPYSSKQWLSNRFNYYDFGYTDLPDGIFDYIIIPASDDAMRLSLIFASPGESDEIWKSFQEVYRNDSYILLQRYAIDEKAADIREFFSRHGLDSSLPPPIN